MDPNVLIDGKRKPDRTNLCPWTEQPSKPGHISLFITALLSLFFPSLIIV